MKPLSKLGISPTPWKVVVENNTCGTMATVRSNHLVMHDGHVEDARLISAAPKMYEALYDCCEEVNGHDAPRCYACRRGDDGHCTEIGACEVFKALARASGEEVAK